MNNSTSCAINISILNNLLSISEDKNIVVLTPNLRLATYLLQRYDSHQRQILNKKAWAVPKIFSLPQWLELCWQECDDERILITEHQETILWVNIISQLNKELAVAQNSIGKIAQDAYTLLKLWNVNLTDLVNDPSEDTRLFMNLATAFDTHLQQNKFCTKSSLPLLLSKLIKEQPKNIPESILLVGFEELSLSPTEKTLLQTFSELHSQVKYINTNTATQTKTTKFIACNHTTEEILTMARWAKNIWQHNPGASIGCIVPNLRVLRSSIAHIFTEVLAPTAILNNQINFAPPFNISLGTPLSNYPITQTAFKVLKLAESSLTTSEISYLLYSPFIAGYLSENDSRALLDESLRSVGSPTISLNEISAKSSCCSGFDLNIARLKEMVRDLTRQKLSPSNWVPIFNQLLESLGWPGDRRLSSHEYQTFERWHELLNEFRGLNNILPKITYQEALKQLQSLANQTIFQPKLEAKSINVLGILEAAGIDFDYLWVMNMDNTTWPTSAHPNPFIPIALQKKLHMPHSSGEHEFNFCQALTSRIMHSAQEVIFSFAKQREDQKLRLSPLLKDIPEINNAAFQSELPNFTPLTEIIRASSSLEDILDNQAPAINDQRYLQGGSSIIKSQAICPFQAFAKHRLQANAFNMNAKNLLRGKMVHHALEQIWQQIHDHATLCAFTEDALNKLIRTSISKTLNKYWGTSAAENNLAQIESQCLERLICNWLAYEKKRDPFEVLALETTDEAILDKLILNLRLDRIDKLSDGNIVIIDYKTGKNAPKPTNWLGERPDEPQLPLYCTITENIAGLLFAHVNIDSQKPFRGTLKATNKNNSAWEKEITIAEESAWKMLLSEWRVNLENLAHNFCNGDALINPKDPSACERCGLKILCRIGTEKR